MNEILDNHPTYGTKYVFLITHDTLRIYQGGLSDSDIIRTIKISDVKAIRYVKGSLFKTILNWLYNIILLILMEADSFGIYRDRIELDHFVEGKFVKSEFETRLEHGDLDEMRTLLNCS